MAHRLMKNFRYMAFLPLANICKNLPTHLLRGDRHNFLPLSKIQQNAKKWYTTAGGYIDLDDITYEKICTETLESLYEYFDEIVESDESLVASDVAYKDGVLTINFGPSVGTYVINRQTPNKQIWLSSPKSGPKRYDFYSEDKCKKGRWVYKHTGETLHELLQNEVATIVKKELNFLKLS